MKKIEVLVDGKKEMETNIEDRDLEPLIKIIKVFESGKINS